MKNALKRILEWRIVRWGRSVNDDYQDCHCSLYAAGLTYFSMLAMIPVLCCILVLAKVAHVDHIARSQINARIDAMITEVEKGKPQITPEEAEQSPEMKREYRKQVAATEFAKQARGFSDQLFTRIERFDVRKLGIFGLAMLLWTVVSSLGQVEISVDKVWGVDRQRPLWKKAYLYLFVATVMPVLATLAMSMPILKVAKNVIVSTMGATWLTKWVSDGLVWFIDFWGFRLLISVGFASLAFGYFLWVMPNCKVKFSHAWFGGLITAVLFGAVLKACAVAQIGISKSSALYGSFSFLPILLAWFYMSWQVVLLGACMVRGFDRMSRTGNG